jgi:hypothetical protein
MIYFFQPSYRGKKTMLNSHLQHKPIGMRLIFVYGWNVVERTSFPHPFFIQQLFVSLFITRKLRHDENKTWGFKYKNIKLQGLNIKN